MLHILFSVLITALMMPGPGCPAPDDADATTVYIVKHAWHAGIAIPWERMEEHGYPALEELEEGAYVEVGWGDANYYPHPEPGIGTTLRAGLWPTMSTLHVATLDNNPRVEFPQTDVLSFPVSENALARMIAYLEDAHTLENGEPIILQDGLYAGGKFFEGHERYHVFNNCNHWVARALVQAGCDVNPTRTMTVEQLLNQIGRFAD